MSRAHWIALAAALACFVAASLPGQEGTAQPPAYGSSVDGHFGGSQPISGFERPLMLSGKVVLDDGAPPPEPVAIYMSCGGRKVPKGYASIKGTFSIDLTGRRDLTFTDASVSERPGPAANDDPTPFKGVDDSLAAPVSGLGRVNFFGCALEVELSGYRSESIELGYRTESDSPDLGTIVLRRMGGVEGTTIRMTTLSAPKKARKAYKKAFKELRKKKPKYEKVERELSRAVAEHPTFAAAWVLLGEVRQQRNDKAAAREAFEKAAASDPTYLKPLTPLLKMALEDQRWNDAVRFAEHILRLNPFATKARFSQAVAQLNLGQVDAAEQSVLALQSGDAANRSPHSYHLLGTILARKGQFEPAAAAFRSYLKARPNSPAAAALRQQLDQWESVGAIQPR